MNANIQDKPAQADKAGNAYLSDLEALRSRARDQMMKGAVTPRRSRPFATSRSRGSVCVWSSGPRARVS